MLNRIRQLNPGASLPQILYYGFLWTMTVILLRVSWGYRAFGSANVPKTGPAIFVSNHQSFLDPVLAGAVTHRHCTYIARIGLFTNAVFRALIKSLNAVPISGKQSDSVVFRQCEEFLAQGRVVLVFPEGTRTPDGSMQPLRPGVLLLIRRSKAPVVPIALEGSYDNWPRDRKLPGRRGLIHAMVGELIPAEELIAMPPKEALEHLRAKIDGMRHELRDLIRHESHGRFPPQGPGDERVA